MRYGIIAAQPLIPPSDDESDDESDPPVEEWVTVYDATTGSFGGGDSTEWADENTRLMIDPSSLAFGSAGYTQIRVTFIAPATGQLEIQNAAFGQAAAVDEFGSFADMINYTSAPTVLTFDGGSPGKTIAAGTEVVSDEVALAAPFDGAHYVIVAINHGSASRMRGRVELLALLASLTDTADDTTNMADRSGDYIGDTIHRSYGVSKIELAA